MNHNLACNLVQTANTHPESIAMRIGDAALTYAELDSASAKVGALLRGHGAQPGDRIGIMLPNVPQFALAYYGVLRAGCVVVPMNVLLKEREVAFYLSDSGAKLVFAWHECADAAELGALSAGAGVVDVSPAAFQALI